MATQLDQMFLSSPHWWQPRTSPLHHTKSSPSSLLTKAGLCFLTTPTAFPSKILQIHLLLSSLLPPPKSRLSSLSNLPLSFHPLPFQPRSYMAIRVYNFLWSTSPSSGAFKPGKPDRQLFVSVWYIGLLLRLFWGKKKSSTALKLFEKC